MSAVIQKQGCEGNLIAAYVDGELDAQETALFESHLESCERCRSELRAHQLFICELDAALTQSDDVAMPLNFSRMVAARASSDMRGVRSRSEHAKALIFCAVLGLISFGLIDGTAAESGVVLAQKGVGRVWGLIGFIWGASYDALASIVVITRVASRRLVVEPRSFAFLLILFSVALFVLSRLISRYHRMGASE